MFEITLNHGQADDADATSILHMIFIISWNF